MESASIVPVVPSVSPSNAPAPSQEHSELTAAIVRAKLAIAALKEVADSTRKDVRDRAALAHCSEFADFPQLHPEERTALEREAGRPFVSDESAHLYRLRRIHSNAVAEMLDATEAR